MSGTNTRMATRLQQLAKRKLPILQWLPNYDGSTAFADIIAGFTVGLTLIPQSIAYAVLAGLSPQYGLYSALTGGLIYMIFGTVPEINIAPTALLSLLTYNYTHGLPAAFAVLLCFLSGLVELVFGVLNMGFLIEFISEPVVAGFTTAAAILIASSQVKNLIGLTFSAEGFIAIWNNIFKNVEHVQIWDSVLSLCCCTVLLGLRQMKNITAQTNDTEKSWKKLIRNTLWFISAARNAIVVLVSATVAYVFHLHGMTPFSLTDEVASGLPRVQLPPFEAKFGNNTVPFLKMATTLGSGIFVVPLVAIIGNIAIAKSFANGKAVHASQEMLALGICNVFGSFFSAMPVNGSFSRSAVNRASGVKTTCGGLYTSVMVIMALSFLTPCFSFIPKAVLGSVIICAVLFMIDISLIKPMWILTSTRLNLIPYFTTFIACLFLGVELGIALGIIIDLIFMLYFSARPRISVEAVTVQQHEIRPNCTSLKPEGPMLFPAAEHMRRAIAKAGDSSAIVVIDCVYVTRADYTAAKGIGAAVTDLKSVGKQVIFLRLKPELREIVSNFCIDECKFIDKEEYLIDVLTEIYQQIETDKNGIKKTGYINQNTISIYTINDSGTKKNSLKKIKQHLLFRQKNFTKWTFANAIDTPGEETNTMMTRL